MSKLPNSTELQKAWEELQDIHAQYLARHDVKLPRAIQYNERAKSIWLAVLFHWEGQDVHKNTISAVCQRDNSNLAPDQQVRHLKRDGWRLISDGQGNHNLDPYQPSLELLNDKTRRDGLLSAKSFEEVKRAFGYSCATCGAREGRPDPRYGEDKVKLQRGHRDPAKAATDKLNIIPQCQFCNRAYRGDFVFDEKGGALAIAGIGPVQRASDEVKQKVLRFLRELFNGGDK
ncbi:MAG: hypothetical protein F4Z39_09980 [Chloroflexi bacterium]|nr:hypothetical protein [Chloroflexota bacterium]